MPALPVGKLPAELLQRLLAELAPSDPRVLVGPGVGLDCAVIDAGGGRCLVAKSDPITFATDEIGWYAVQVNANDIATTGAEPRWFLATLLLPEAAASEALVEAIFRQVRDACRQIGVAVVGGHTEVTYGLARPLLSGAMLGEVERERLVLPSGARPGDVLLLTKRLAVEATAILAREKSDLLAAAHVPSAILARSRAFLRDPGIGVLPEARAALAAGRVHAMHDPTEGGLATGLHEIAVAAGVGVIVDADAVLLYDETRALCEPFGIDPWGVIASGSLLLAVPASEARAILAELRSHRIEAAAIGEIVERERGVLRRDAQGRLEPLPRFERDEIAKAFASPGLPAGASP